MSIKIDLEFETRFDSELLSVGISTRLIRLIASLRLKTAEGWSDPYKAIIDTGSVDSDTVPLIIGFEDILTDIKLVCDYRTKTAFLQIPV